MGPSAEKPVIAYLGAADRDLRIEACTILGVIGTQACLPTLTQTRDNDADVNVRRAADVAVKAVSAR